eukprot:XP_014065566.1 PREDICTED: doublecortin domain-containing protein 2B isoform X2 [Salmo salar]
MRGGVLDPEQTGTKTASGEMASSVSATLLLPPVKSVMVYRNGDSYSGRRFVVNHRQVATMEAFLNDMTHCIQALLAVRTLYTPVRDTGSGSCMTSRPGPTSGPNSLPFRFIIPRTWQRDLDQILGLITEKANLRTGAVRRLCTLEGVTVSSADELESGQYYVAVGAERFNKLPYVELLVPKATERIYPGIRRLSRRYEGRKAARGPEDRYSDSALLDSPESDGRRVKSTGDEVRKTALPAIQKRPKKEMHN